MQRLNKLILATAAGLLVSQACSAATPTYQFRHGNAGLRVATSTGSTGVATPTTPSNPTGPAKPVIVSLVAEAPAVTNKPGNYQYVTWETSGADSASVTCSGLVTGSETGTTGEMWPDVVGNGANGTGTCTLTATNSAGSTQQSVTFPVVAPPTIPQAAFDSINPSIGQYNTLRWNTADAVTAKVTCSSGFKATSLSGVASVPVTAGWNYCSIEAWNAAGSRATAIAGGFNGQ